MKFFIKNYSFLLLSILFVFTNCKDADAPDEGQESIGLDNTNLIFQQPVKFSEIGMDTNFTWKAAEQEDYVYGLKIALIDPNDTDFYTALQGESEVTVKDLEDNQYTLLEDLTPASYYIVAVVKYPNDMTFNDFIETVPDEDLFNYIDTTYVVTEGDLAQGPGCTTDSCAASECPNGNENNCECSNGFCFCTLCATKSEMVLLDFETP